VKAARPGVLAALLGILAGAFSILVNPLDGKVAVAAAVGVCALVVWLALGTRWRTISLLVVFIFGISLKLNKTFFLEELSTWQYVPFAAGAAGITVGLNDLAAALLLLRRRGARGDDPSAPGVAWAVVSGPLLFMAAGVASLVHAGDPNLVGFELWRQTLLLLSLVAAMKLPLAQQKVALRLMALGVGLQGVIACAQVVSGGNLGLEVLGEQPLVQEQIDFAYQARAVGTIGHSNILAYFFEISLPVMLAMAIVSRGVMDRLLFLGAIGAGLAGLLETQSRAAWVAVPITMGVVFLHYFARHLLRLRAALIAVGAALVCSAGFVAVWPIISQRVFSDDAGSTDSRAPLNQAALSVIGQFPVFGVGLNNLANAFPSFDLTHNTRVFGDMNHVVHNMYLLALAEVGVVGFLPFLWCFAGPIWLGWRLRRSEDRLAQAMGVGGAMGLVAHLIHGTFDPGFKLSLPVSSLIAVQTGLIGAAWLRHRALAATSRVARSAPPRVVAPPDAWPVQGGRLRPRGVPSARAFR
jgi:O-antigen ligase